MFNVSKPLFYRVDGKMLADEILQPVYPHHVYFTSRIMAWAAKPTLSTPIASPIQGLL